jgi:hypothetical protein
MSSYSRKTFVSFIISYGALSYFVVANLSYAAQERGRVAVHATNPRYLQDASGKPIVIIGFGNEAKNRTDILDELKGKINYQRAYVALWGRRQDPKAYEGGRPWPMVGGKADMDVWNEIFWANLRSYLKNTGDRDISVGLTIWDGHYDLPGGKAGGDSVWNSQYNLQGVQWRYDYEALVNFSNPNPRSSNVRERLVYYQRRWVDRLIEEIKTYPNVVIELDNETKKASESWFLWWADYFLKRGDFVIATTWNSRYTISDETFAKERRLHMKSYHSRSDEPITPKRLSWNKVIVADADNKCSNFEGNSARKTAWRSFLKGGHWNDFVCADWKGFPDSTKIQYYRHLLNFIRTRAVPFADMEPNSKIVSSGTALAKPGLYYLAYVEGSVDIDLSSTRNMLEYEWYDPRTGMKAGQGQVQGGSGRTFSPPGPGDFVLWVRAASGAKN